MSTKNNKLAWWVRFAIIIIDQILFATSCY